MQVASDVPSDALMKVISWLLDQPGVTDLLREKLGSTPPPASSAANTDSGPLLLTLEQAAEAAGVAKSRMYGLVAGGGIAAIRFGRAIRIPRQAIVDWIQDSAKKASQVSTEIVRSPSPSPLQEGARRPYRGSGREVAPVTPATYQPNTKRSGRIEREPNPFLGIKRIAAKLRISPEKAGQLVKSGQIFTFKIGNRLVCGEWHLDEYIRLKGQQPPEGWERYFRKLMYQRAPEAEKREMLNDGLGFDPETGTFAHERDQT